MLSKDMFKKHGGKIKCIFMSSKDMFKWRWWQIKYTHMSSIDIFKWHGGKIKRNICHRNTCLTGMARIFYQKTYSSGNTGKSNAYNGKRRI